MNGRQHVLIIGHRGAKGHAFENSLSSMRCALELGVDMIELDVFRCRSGELIVFHDEDLDELTDRSGSVEQLSLDEIRKVKLRNGEGIPTLQEVMCFLNGRVQLNIELKGRNTARALLAQLRSMPGNTNWKIEQCLVSSFHWEELEQVRLQIPELRIALLTESDPTAALETALRLKAWSVHPWYRTVTAGNALLLKENGIRIYPYTVDEPEDIQRMIELGVDGIISDFPERIAMQLAATT